MYQQLTSATLNQLGGLKFHTPQQIQTGQLICYCSPSAQHFVMMWGILNLAAPPWPLPESRVIPNIRDGCWLSSCTSLFQLQSREPKHPDAGHHLPTHALKINPRRTFTPPFWGESRLGIWSPEITVWKSPLNWLPVACPALVHLLGVLPFIRCSCPLGFWVLRFSSLNP